MTSKVKELVEAAKEYMFSASGDANRLMDAISAVESEGDGWIKIKDGCEMPAEGADILFNIPWCYGVEKGRYFSGRWISDRTSPYGDQISFDVEEATHWQPLPAPPNKEGR